MDAATLDRMVTDLLLIEASDGVDAVARRLCSLRESWTAAGADEAALAWLDCLAADLDWWSGRLLGGLSFVNGGQGLPDTDARSAVS